VTSCEADVLNVVTGDLVVAVQHETTVPKGCLLNSNNLTFPFRFFEALLSVVTRHSKFKQQYCPR
jgi:hypothetical protein